MFGVIFAKECKQILHSLIYYIYLMFFVLFMVSQLGETTIVKEPKPEDNFYGMKESEDPNDIMSYTLSKLFVELSRKEFATYPMGFYKGVKLSAEDKNEVVRILELCTGQTWNQLRKAQTEYFSKLDITDEEEIRAAEQEYQIPSAVSYSVFQTEMKKVSKIIGKGSAYESSKYRANVMKPMTYEEAEEDYQALCKTDGITDAFMRLFCDYAGIILSFIPLFLGVTRCVRDKRAKADQIIYSRKASSGMIILSRYLSNVAMIFLPVVILAILFQISYMYQASTLGVTPHYMAFLNHTVVWNLPTLLFVLALSFVLTELFNGIVAIVIQLFGTLLSFMSSMNLVGNFGVQLIPRWNIFGKTLRFEKEKYALYLNRGLYLALSIVLILFAIFLYERKRKGGLHANAKE